MSTENYSNTEAKEKLKSLAEDIKFAMMVTGFQDKPLDAIPMSTKKVDDAGNIWFLSLRSSEHNQNIERTGAIQLLYSKPSDMEFLSVYGTGEIVTEKEKIKELYDSADDSWFDGADDPQATAIKFTPSEAYYWDTKDNKYVSLLKMGAAAITGKDQDVGKKGKLNL
ncbi:pyridoxamine 5'-phosphate oxidase family protein [Salinimicrobium sp. GXAS 041]|uniref:pyridoxamine 5'-phosphate oxidase family protein n=1 Tax=Salinimicrobium sp. GXAS 041 TaxID=3400806 RepID=UPI003C740679